MAQDLRELITRLQREGKLGKDIAEFLRLEGYKIGEVQSAMTALDYVTSIEPFTRDVYGLHVSDRPMQAGVAALIAVSEPRALPWVIWHPRKPKHFVFAEFHTANLVMDGFWAFQDAAGKPRTSFSVTAAEKADLSVKSATGETAFEAFLQEHYAGEYEVHVEKQVHTWLDGVLDE